MATKPLTKKQKVYNMLVAGKPVKLSTVAKKLYGSDDYTSKENARRIINELRCNSDLMIDNPTTGVYQAE